MKTYNDTLLPDPFIDKMAGLLAKKQDESQLAAFIAACHRPLRTAIRVNTLKISVEGFKQRALDLNWQLTNIAWCEEGFWIEREDETIPLGNSFEHLSGLCYIQEASSMLPVSALFHFIKATPETILLDAAAAPGSKTTQIAAQMQNKGLIVANEYSASRVKMLHANMSRCGIKNVALTNFSADIFGKWLPDTFDAILLDTPCSGEGTIRKDKNAMKNWSESAISSISDTQKTLITSAFQSLKADGILIYSTCTLSHEENQDICLYLKERYPDSVEFLDLTDLFEGANKSRTKEGFLHIWPQIYDTEGFFVAAIKKREKVEIEPAKKRLGKFPYIRPTRQKEAELYEYFETQFGIKNIDGMLYLRDQSFWLFPDPIKGLLKEIRFSRLGIKIAKEFGKSRKTGFKTNNEFVTSFGQKSTQQVELNSEQAVEFYQGKDIRGVDIAGLSGEIVVSYKGNVIGLGKALSNRIKNNLPRELIRDKNLFVE